MTWSIRVQIKIEIRTQGRSKLRFQSLKSSLFTKTSDRFSFPFVIFWQICFRMFFKVQEIFLFLQFLQLSRKWKISRNHGLNLFLSFLHSKVEMKAHDKRRLNNLLLNFSLTPKSLWENPEYPDVSDIIVGALLGLLIHIEI